MLPDTGPVCGEEKEREKIVAQQHLTTPVHVRVQLQTLGQAGVHFCCYFKSV